MASSMDSVSENTRATLESLSPEDQQLFLEERRKVLERGVGNSSLLDQLCCLRLIMTRLAEGHEVALNAFDQALGDKLKQRTGWRKSVIRKLSGEYESPMPWMHPFKLAREELQPLEERLEAAVGRGETEELDLSELQRVLERHHLELPLPSPFLPPPFPPGGVRTYK
jgi:hypothetical protein